MRSSAASDVYKRQASPRPWPWGEQRSQYCKLCIVAQSLANRPQALVPRAHLVVALPFGSWVQCPGRRFRIDAGGADGKHHISSPGRARFWEQLGIRPDNARGCGQARRLYSGCRNRSNKGRLHRVAGGSGDAGSRRRLGDERPRVRGRNNRTAMAWSNLPGDMRDRLPDNA